MSKIIWEERKCVRVLLAGSGAIVLTIAIAERLTKADWPVAVLYALPIVMAAGFLPRWAVALLGLICALMSALARGPDMLALKSLALAGCGLFSGEWIRNRRLSMEAQERLRVLVETMPAAVFTVDERGFVELANRAATELVLPRDGRLVGSPITAFFPELYYALRLVEGSQRATQCRAYRGNGESFIARAGFSTYKEGASLKLAVVIADVTEDAVVAGSSPRSGCTNNRLSVSDREAEVLRFVVQGLLTKEIAARMGVSESTVKNALQQLFAKTEVRTRAQLVKVALENYQDLLSGPASEASPVSPPHKKNRDSLSVVECGRAGKREKVRAISEGSSLRTTSPPGIVSIAR